MKEFDEMYLLSALLFLQQSIFLEIANKGWKRALNENPHLRNGLNVCFGEITHKGVAESLNIEYIETPSALRE